jgi:hypothetical protein
MLEADLDQMAEKFFGYGSWNGDVCFIGPEQGMSKDESTLSTRLDAWKRMEARDLLDCQAYHREINEHRWHGNANGSKIKPQSTWKRLIRTALAYRNMPTSPASVLSYQANGWAASGGKDCVIELSGLPAHNQGVNRPYSETALEKRIDEIERRLSASDFRVVLLYGQGRRKSSLVAWRRLTHGLAEDKWGLFTICRSRSSIFVLGPHPTAPIEGNSNDAWIQLGKKLRQVMS